MEAKLCLALMLFTLGSLTVQGAIPRNPWKNPLAAFARQQHSIPNRPVGYCTSDFRCREGYHLCFLCPCNNPTYGNCCCPNSAGIHLWKYQFNDDIDVIVKASVQLRQRSMGIIDTRTEIRHQMCTKYYIKLHPIQLQHDVFIILLS